MTSTRGVTVASRAISRRRMLLLEAGGAVLALAMTAIVVTALTGSDRRVLLFSDGDSLLTVLVHASVAAGQPQDWAMSSVLFIPEIAVYEALSLFGLGVVGTLTLNAFVNYLALYAALRLVAGGRAHAKAPVLGALVAFGAFCVLSLLESSPDRDALELASLLATTTYYASTVVCVVLVVGITRHVVDRASRIRPVLLIALGAVAAVATLSNPLFLAWAVAPLLLVSALTAGVFRRSRRALVWAGAALVAGAVAGFVGRIPLSHLIANTGAGYADPSRGGASLVYYGDLFLGRLASDGGVAAIVLGTAIWLVAVLVSVRARRRGLDAVAFVAASAWVIPVVVLVGAIVLGTEAARYLQPLAFAPVLVLCVIPEFVRLDLGRRRRLLRVGGIGAAVLIVGVSIAGIPQLFANTARTDPDVECVTRWVEESGQIGAGQFWTVRSPKAHLADPRQLVQVDNEMRGYAWLVNRDDFAPSSVSFLVVDAQSAPFVLPDGLSLGDGVPTSCGAYTIIDFAPRTIPLGPQRS